MHPQPTMSLLRRLPPGLPKKQALFLDGLRHASDIAEFAYDRLCQTLTAVASSKDPRPVDEKTFTSAFVDAWAIVDSVDRFRSLWQLLPGRIDPPEKPPQQSFGELTKPIRDLRNVADHLAQRSDYVVSTGGTALGVLTWCTREANVEGAVATCALIPGTRNWESVKFVNPADDPLFVGPTAMIRLSAGEHVGDLSAVMPILAARVVDLEAALEQAFREGGVAGEQAGSDIFFAFRGWLDGDKFHVPPNAAS